jgi:hypothetical protein
LDSILIYGLLWKEKEHYKGKKNCDYIRFEVFMAVTIKNAVFGMRCHVAFVRTNSWEEHITSFIKVKRISELGTMLEVTINLINDGRDILL